jgi:hypothetical protein
MFPCFMNLYYNNQQDAKMSSRVQACLATLECSTCLSNEYFLTVFTFHASQLTGVYDHTSGSDYNFL